MHKASMIECSVFPRDDRTPARLIPPAPPRLSYLLIAPFPLKQEREEEKKTWIRNS